MTTVQPAAPLWQQTTFRRHRGSILRALTLGFLAAATLLVVAAPALGQSTWTGATNNDWTDAGNWTSGVPNAADTVTIDVLTPNTPKLDGAGVTGTTGNLTIGTSSGNGFLEVVNGASLSSVHGSLAITLGSVGNMLIAGPATTWALTGTLAVGEYGQGRLEANSGATITAQSVSVATMAGSDGTLVLAGFGTDLTLLTGITVGQNGTGVLQMSDQATLQAVDATIGAYPAGSGLAHISGAGTRFSLSHALIVANATTGTLDIDGGAEVTSDSVLLGENSSGVGIVHVHDAGSTLTSTGNLTIGDIGRGEVTVWNAGAVTVGGTLRLTNGASSVGTLNIGAATGQTARAAGTVNASTVQFGSGTGTLNFNHTDSAYAFASQLLGSGTVNQIAGTTTLTANSETFAGTTNVTGGKLVVSGRLGGTISVSGGGTIGGTGRLGNVSFGTGAVAAPGNSIGTLNTTDLTFNAGSFFDVEVDSAGQSDLIYASNSATLNGGTVRVSAFPDYLLGYSYNIIYSPNGLTGTFTDATTNLAFITPVLSYDGQNAFVTLFQSSNFVVAAATPNQQAVAKALDTLPTNNPIVQSMLGLTAPEARVALDNLSGEAHASVRSVLLEKSRVPREAAFDRLAHDEEGMWALVEASHVSLASDGNAAAVGAGGFDLAAGADAYFGEWLAGLLIHGGTAGLSVPDRSTTGTINTIGLGAYAGTDWETTALDLGLDLALHGINTQRSFSMGRRFSAGLTGNYGAATAQAFGRLSHEFSLPALVLRPYGEAAYVVTTSGGFTEAGGPAALNVAQGTDAALFTTLGLDMERELVLEDGSTLTFGGGLGWRHAFADQPKSTHAFAAGDSFTIAGTPLGGDALVLEAGLGWKTVKQIGLDLSYDGILSGSGQSHVFKGTLAGQY